jgi:hypothetical protein
MSKTIVFAAGLGVLLAAPGLAQQQQPSPMFNQLTACRAIADEQARLACFDKASAAIAEAVEKGNLALIDREQVRKVRRSLFGFAVPKFPFFGDKDSEANDDEPKEIQTTLRSFAAMGNGRYRVAIAEPQSVWETTESTSYTEPRQGAKVTIKGGVLGSYFMQVGSNRWARARRVR